MPPDRTAGQRRGREIGSGVLWDTNQGSAFRVEDLFPVPAPPWLGRAFRRDCPFPIATRKVAHVKLHAARLIRQKKPDVVLALRVEARIGLTKSIALDGRESDTACSQIDIGNAATEMTLRMTAGVPQANGTTMVEPGMNVRHVAEAVLCIANLPLDAKVLFMTEWPQEMPFVGRG